MLICLLACTMASRIGWPSLDCQGSTPRIGLAVCYGATIRTTAALYCCPLPCMYVCRICVDVIAGNGIYYLHYSTLMENSSTVIGKGILMGSMFNYRFHPCPLSFRSKCTYVTTSLLYTEINPEKNSSNYRNNIYMYIPKTNKWENNATVIDTFTSDIFIFQFYINNEFFKFQSTFSIIGSLSFVSVKNIFII